MFKSREQLAGHSPSQFGLRENFVPHGAAALSLAQAIPEPSEPARLRRGRRKDWRQLAHEWRYEHLPALREVDWVPDLAIDIGSARWFRGLGTMVGLSAAALLFWPDFSAVEAAPTMQLDTTTRDEFRSQMIMPLALGGDSGRRMGATAAVVPLGSAPERPTVQLTATLGQGDSFGRMLQRAGVGADEAARIADMVAARVPLADIAPGTRFDLTLGRRTTPDRPRPVDDLAFRARFDLDLSVQRSGGGLALVAKPIAVDETPLRIKGIVGSSLYRSARAAGAPTAAIQQYLRTLDQHINLEQDLRPSDEFDIVVAYKRAASGEVQAGDLMFAGVTRDGKPRIPDPKSLPPHVQQPVRRRRLLHVVQHLAEEPLVLFPAHPQACLRHVVAERQRRRQLRLAAQQVRRDLLPQHLQRLVVGRKVVRKDQQQPPATRAVLGNARPQQRRPPQVHPVPPWVVAPPQLLGRILCVRIQPHLLHPQRRVPPDDLHRLAQPLPRECGAQDVVAIDHRLQCRQVLLQTRAGVELRDARRQVRVALLRQQIVEEESLLQRGERRWAQPREDRGDCEQHA